MFVTNDEKEKALENLHQIPRAVFAIPDKLDRITNRLDTLNDTLDRIADALETIAAETVREREELETQHRARQTAAAGRTFSAISSGRGRGE